ncbi:hypothetical protein TESS_TESS_02338 [Tessaracoccus sp. O5.2]|uniref:hypothetical protein n=1 Tax=Tessaracoccus TaxID=72763 RepID=UPI003341040C
MSRPPLDLSALAVGLAAVGFGIVLITAPLLAAPFMQPILAVILAAAGAIGLLASRGRTPRKELP